MGKTSGRHIECAREVNPSSADNHLDLLNETFVRIDTDAKMKLKEKLMSYGREEAFRSLPGFNSLLDKMLFD